MSYKFRLETLLTYRFNLEELAQQKLGHEQNILEGHRNRLTDLGKHRQEMIAKFEEKKKEKMSAAIFTLYTESFRNRDREIVAQKILIDSQVEIVNQCREELVLRVQDRKVIEKAREKDYKVYLQEVQHKELLEADEMAVLRFGRKLAL